MKTSQKRPMPVTLVIFLVAVTLALVLGVYLLVTGLSNPQMVLPNPWNTPVIL